MPVANCTCGHQTNSACSNFWMQDGKPTECYARVIGGTWSRGCGYDQADENEKQFADELIEKTRGA